MQLLVYCQSAAVNAGKNKPANQTITGQPAAKLDAETEDFHRKYNFCRNQSLLVRLLGIVGVRRRMGCLI